MKKGRKKELKRLFEAGFTRYPLGFTAAAKFFIFIFYYFYWELCFWRKFNYYKLMQTCYFSSQLLLLLLLSCRKKILPIKVQYKGKIMGNSFFSLLRWSVA